jgi:hypothetical protein
VTRAAVLRDADISDGIGQFAVIQAVAPSVGVDVRPINMHDAAEIEHAVTTFARAPKGRPKDCSASSSNPMMEGPAIRDGLGVGYGGSV